MGKKRKQQPSKSDPIAAEDHSEQKTESEDADEGQEIFHVEVVSKARVDENMEWEYLVKWAGYGSDEDSWEPQGNLNSDRLLGSFWNHIGSDDRDWPVGTVFEAKPSWIKRERDFFWKEYNESDNGKKKKEKEKKQRRHSAITVSASNTQLPLKRKEEKSREAAKKVKDFVQSLNSGDDDSDETPLSNLHPSASTSNDASSKAKSKKRSTSASTRRVDSESESNGNNVPLYRQSKDNGKAKAKMSISTQKRKDKDLPMDAQRKLSSGKLSDSEPPRKLVKLSKTFARNNAVAGPSIAQQSQAEAVPQQYKAQESKNLDPRNMSADATEKPLKTVGSESRLEITIPTSEKGKALPQEGDSAPESPQSVNSLFSGTDSSPAKHPPPSGAAQPSDTPRSLSTSNIPTVKTSSGGGLMRKASKPDPHKVQASSNLPTKQRLAEAAVLINPKTMKSSKASPVLGSGQGSLSKLSFRKGKSMAGPEASPIEMEKPPAPNVSSPVTRDPRTSALASKLISMGHARSSTSVVSQEQVTDTPIVRSPSPMQVSDNEGARNDLPPSVRRLVELEVRKNAAVEDFLSTVPIPNEQFADGEDTSADKTAYPPPSAKATVPFRIPKKFKWIGEVFMHTQKDRGEKLFEGVLMEEPPEQANALRFAYCMGEKVNSLHLTKLFHLFELELLRPAWASVAQYGRLEPREEKDRDAFTALVHYMDPRQLTAYAPLYLSTHDSSPCAILLLFPHSSRDLCETFHISQSLRQPGGFVAVLIPWTVAATAVKERRTRYTPEERAFMNAPSVLSNPDPVKIADLSRSLRLYPSYHRALHMLQFPDWLHQYMSQPERKYALWFEPSDGFISNDLAQVKGSDTRALETVLKKCGAQRVNPKEDSVRAIFVHVGALVAFQNFTSLAKRRKKWPWMQFFTYGTHESIPPVAWGIQEIYPLGGIVTFTPTAFRDNQPHDIFKFINKVKIHPLWECYIIPSTLAMVARDACGSDPFGVWERGGFVYQDLLEMIANGTLALLIRPPYLQKDAASIKEWASSQLSIHSMDERDILQFCVRTFQQEHEDTEPENWPLAVQGEVLNSLSAMQVQPSIMKNYRRFVAVRGRLEYDGKEDKKDSEKRGAEWTTLSDFEWKDDFFSGDLAPAMSNLNIGY